MTVNMVNHVLCEDLADADKNINNSKFHQIIGAKHRFRTALTKDTKKKLDILRSLLLRNC